MCIICTEEIYKENLYTLTDLNVANCSNLTSEKLQEVLIQCKNLIKLDCHYCTSLTSLDLQSNINLSVVLCNNCPYLTSLDLWSSSEGVTSKGCINLKELYCYNCPFLTSLDLRNNSEGVTSFGCINLKILWCFCCTSLTSLDLRNNINLTTLWCFYCTSLTSLDLRNNINLTTLNCSSCTSLTNLDLKGFYDYIDHSKCPWICQNEEFPSNLQRLIKIQKWYKRILIIKYMKSREFIEWIYNPSNIGGRLYKKWLLKNLK